MLQPKQLFSKF
ncbi:hypothetical protein E2320_015122, partial [Naja naja]